MPSGVSVPAPPRARAEARDAALWLGLVGTGLALTALAVVLDVRLGTASAPFAGSYRIELSPGSLLAPLVAVVVLLAVRSRLHETLPWRRVLALSYLAAAAWALALALADGGAGLAGPVAESRGFLADVPAVGDDPAEFLRGFVAGSDDYTVPTRQHPPGPVLLLWALVRAGVERPLVLGVLITLIGVTSVPLLGVAVRSLCGELSARRLLPVLALAPYAIWLAVSMDAVTLALCAAFVAVGVAASERGRDLRAALALAGVCGLLVGVAALFSYSAPWLGISVLAVYFVRRRPLLNLVTGAAALLPLALSLRAGFSWPEGLTAAQADFSERVQPERPFAIWAALNVLLLLIACGPALVTAARGLRRTPGWPFLVGASAAVVFATVSGLSRGEVERSWLAFFPFLLVAAVAPPRRPSGPEDPLSSPTPWRLVALGAASAIVIEAVLRTAW